LLTDYEKVDKLVVTICRGQGMSDSNNTKTKLINILDQCEFLNGLSEKKKYRFQEKLEVRLETRRSTVAGSSDSSLVVDEVNVKEIKSTIQTTVSFSWLGFFFSWFWAAYHKIQFAYAGLLLFYVPSYILLFINYDWYEAFNDFVMRIGPIAIGMTFGMYGRGWLIGDQFSIIAREEYQINSQTSPKWFYIGTGFGGGWTRVLVMVGFCLVLSFIEVGLEYLLYPETW